MAIYLDTCIIAGVKNVGLAEARAVARAIGQDVVLPEVVVEELLAARHRKVEAAAKRFWSAFDELVRLGAQDPDAEESISVAPEPQAVAERLRKQLTSEYTIIGTPPDVAAESLRREAWRRRPAGEKKGLAVGARDAAIWLTALNDHKRRAEPGYFISKNTSDFCGAEGAEFTLHEHLNEDVAGLQFPLRFLPRLDELFAVLEVPQVPIMDVGRIKEAVDAQPVVKSALAAELSCILPELPLQLESARCTSIAPSTAYYVNEATVAAVSAQWILQTKPAFSAGVFATTQLWLRIREGLIEVEVEGTSLSFSPPGRVHE